MGVDRDFSSMRMRFVHQRLQFLEGVLDCVESRSLGKNTAGRARLDQVHAELHVFTNLLPNLPGSVGDPGSRDTVLMRQKVIVAAMPAGNANGRPGNEHSRPGHFSCSDSVPQCNVRISGRTHVSHRRESRLQGSRRVLDAIDRCFGK